MKNIILASNSPRRRELLENIGLQFRVIPDNTPEPKDENMLPFELVTFLAKFKGENTSKKISDEDALIISADTVVSINGEILGKPHSHEEAFEMLSKLSGNTHHVYTGVYVLDKSTGKSVNFYEKTEVSFKSLDIDEINDYINTEEPMDKAGAYGIQNIGSIFVEGVKGDYFNVVGLPVCRLCKVIKESFGIKFF